MSVSSLQAGVGRHRQAERLRHLLRRRQLRRHGEPLWSHCDTNGSHVRADQVVSSYSLEVSLFCRQSAARCSADTPDVVPTTSSPSTDTPDVVEAF